MASAAQAISRLLGSLGGADKGADLALWRNWQQVLGPELAPLAKPLGRRGSVLVLGVDDPIIAQELSYYQPEILARANAYVAAANSAGFKGSSQAVAVEAVVDPWARPGAGPAGSAGLGWPGARKPRRGGRRSTAAGKTVSQTGAAAPDGAAVFDKISFELLRGRVPLGQAAEASFFATTMTHPRPRTLGGLARLLAEDTPQGRAYRAYMGCFTRPGATQHNAATHSGNPGALEEP